MPNFHLIQYLKHFALNTAKNFINSFPNTYYYKLGGANVIFGGALPSLPPKIRLCLLFQAGTDAMGPLRALIR